MMLIIYFKIIWGHLLLTKLLVSHLIWVLSRLAELGNSNRTIRGSPQEGSEILYSFEGAWYVGGV